MAENSVQECQLRRRRSGPKLPLNLEVGYQVTDGGPSQGTPSPCTVKFTPESKDASTSSELMDFRKRQQSFEILIEDCEEEDFIIDSDDDIEAEELNVDRPVTPTPIQDFAASVSYMEGPNTQEFLKVNTIENDCVTDISEAESGDEE